MKDCAQIPYWYPRKFCPHFLILHGYTACISDSIFIPPLQWSWEGVYWFHLVHLSVFCGWNGVCSVSSTILAGSMLFTLIVKCDVLFAFSNSITAKILISDSVRTFIVMVNGERTIWVQFTQMAGSGTNALGWHAHCRNIPFIDKSMLFIPTFSLGPLIYSSFLGECYSVMMVLSFLYRAISCDAEYYQLYWNGRDLMLFNYRMIKCLCISWEMSTRLSPFQCVKISILYVDVSNRNDIHLVPIEWQNERRLMPKYPWLPKLVYVPSVETVKQSGLWNSPGICVYEYVQRMETMKQSGLWNSLSTHGSLVIIWWLCISSGGQARKVALLSQIWPWRSRSMKVNVNCLRK